MDLLVAPVAHVKFDLEVALANQMGVVPLPFPGMDKSGAAVCELYVRATCHMGTSCPFRHVRGDKAVVCKHWLRGLCKKGDGCEFLHEYDMSKMPECYFYTRYNACHNKECPFLHIDPETKIRDCPWYDRGFCRHGPHCRHRHVRRVMCINYLAGFCPAGPNCTDAHPRFELPMPTEVDLRTGKKLMITCHFCNEPGHKISNCPNLPEDIREQQNAADARGLRPHMAGPRGYGIPSNGYTPRVMKNLSEVTCFKCGEIGHFANKCPKGHLAFLSSHHQFNRDNIP